MKRQRGSALLLAMLTVALVATLSSAAVWHLWRSAELEAADRDRQQALWLLSGSLDWARDVLYRDARGNNGPAAVDHLQEAWSQPLSAANFLGFLSADPLPGDSASVSVAVTAQIVDLQARLNFRNLVKYGNSATKARAFVSAPDLATFHRLFELLGLPAGELEQAAARLVDVLNRLRQDENPRGSDLLPQDMEQLTLLGLSAPSLAALRPHATLLPERSSLNINTASAHALCASVPGMSLAEARSQVQARVSTPFISMAQANERIAALRNNPIEETVLDVNSEFFEVNTRVSMANVFLQERTILNRQDINLTVIRRVHVLPAAL